MQQPCSQEGNLEWKMEFGNRCKSQEGNLKWKIELEDVKSQEGTWNGK
jgi:hypothetical protein